MTRKSCAVGMRNAILRNYLNCFFHKGTCVHCGWGGGRGQLGGNPGLKGPCLCELGEEKGYQMVFVSIYKHVSSVLIFAKMRSDQI